MTDSTRGKPTVGRLREILAQFPDDAVWWAYEGEVSGIIVSHAEVNAVLHNDGDVDIHHASEPEPEPEPGKSSVTSDEIAATLDPHIWPEVE